MLVRRRVASAALVLLVPAAAACGFSEQTDQVYQPATGTNDRSGEVDVLNALVVAAGNQSGTFAGTFSNENQSKAIQLVGVTGPQVKGSQAAVSIPASGIANMALKGQITVSGPQVEAGKFVDLTFNFSNGQSTTMSVPVVGDTGDYANVPLPGSSQSASPSASPSAKKGAPTSTSSTSASTSPSASPSSSPSS
jgi:copper(I)-binding protein